MNTTAMKIVCVGSVAVAASSAFGHDGRRLDIQVYENQLIAQGYISGADPSDDGGGVVRPYINAIHGHWTNNPSPGIDAASATLPGFDLFSGGALTGSSLSLELVGASKWSDVPTMPAPGTVPDLQPLVGEEIFVGYQGDFHSTAAPGSFTLIESVAPGGLLDIDLTYDIASEPVGSLYVLEFVLSTSAAGIADSSTVHVILSPDGANHMERLHHASLYLESYLGTPIPAPGAAGLLGFAGVAVVRRRRA